MFDSHAAGVEPERVGGIKMRPQRYPFLPDKITILVIETDVKAGMYEIVDLRGGDPVEPQEGIGRRLGLSGQEGR